MTNTIHNFLFCIWELMGSSLIPNVTYLYTDVLHEFPQYHQSNVERTIRDQSFFHQMYIHTANGESVVIYNTAAYLLKARTVEPEKQPLL
jgi:uncharacterized membrane protein